MFGSFKKQIYDFFFEKSVYNSASKIHTVMNKQCNQVLNNHYQKQRKEDSNM